jgi:hypothetical protein
MRRLQWSKSDSRTFPVQGLAMIHDANPFRCPVCGNTMCVIAVIRDPEEIRTLIACSAKHGRGPPDEG